MNFRTTSVFLVITILHLLGQIPVKGQQVGGLEIGAGQSYRGKHIGPLTARQHKVSGEVFAVDARTLHIKGFTYDGTGPDAFFWTGFTDLPSPDGIIVPDEKGTKQVLGAYTNQDITITLPDGLTLRDIKWFAVWCRAYEVNFGDLQIPPDFDFPQPHVIGSLQGQHGVSSGPIVVIDAQTILVPDFTYDGKAPDVHFWVGKGKPGPEGARVPSDTGGDEPLVKSDRKTMVLSLPGDLTVFDIDYFGVWCRLYYVDFGHVRVPPLNVPPSLRMLNLTPQLLATLTSPPVYQHPGLLTLGGNYVQQHDQPVVSLSPEQLYHGDEVLQYVNQVQPNQFFQHSLTSQQHQIQPPLLLDPNHQGQLVYQTQPHPHQLIYSTNVPVHQQNIAQKALPPPPPGTNGFSTFTIKTSKGSSTAVSLY